MTTPLRILIVEDSPDDAELIALRLAEESFQPEWQRVQTEPDYLAALEAPPDLILADWSLPQFSGLRALQLMRERWLDIPFVIVSGSIGEEAAIEALHLGASDYVLKDRPARLGQAVKHALEEKHLRDEKRQAERALHGRVKELTCLYAVGRNMQEDLSVDELCRRAIEHLVPAMQFPEITVPVIELDDRRFTSEKYAEGLSHGLRAEIRVGGEARGQVGVYYAEDRPFVIPEEQNLLNGIAEALGRWLEHKRAERELWQLSSVVEQSSEGMAIADLEGNLLFVNNAWAQMHGYDTGEGLIGQHLEISHNQEQLEQDVIPFNEKVKEKGSHTGEVGHIRKDGTPFPTLMTATLLKDEQGSPYAIAGIAKDITERVRSEEERAQAEARITHLNEVLRAVRDVNQLITRERDPQRLMSEACAILMRTRGYRLVWIGLIEEGHRRVIPAAHAGQGADFLDQVTITWDESETGQEPTGTAIRTRRPAECRSIATDPRYAPWREAALACGFGSSAAAPMVYNERLFGTVTVYADRPEAFDEEEIGLLSELAADMAFALQSAEDETERKQVEEMLQQHIRALALINQASREFGSTLDPDRVFATVLEEARCLMDITASSIWLVDPETQELVCCQATGPKSESVIGWRLAPGEGIAGWVTTHGESLIVPDTDRDERHSAEVNRQIGLTVRSILSVPLRSKQSVIGVLQMLDVVPMRFDEQDLRVLEPLAAAAAIAIENARLYQQAQQEIEERRQAEEQLRQSEATLKQAQEVAHVGSWRWHIQSSRVEWSDEMYRIFGIGKEDFTGDLADVIERAIHPDDRAAVEQSNRSVAEDKRPAPLEYRIIRPDRTIRTVWTETGELVLDDAGNPAVITGIVRDITERKQAEVALQRYIERLRILHAIDGIILAAQSPQEIGQAILRHLQELVPSDRVLISSFDLEKERATALASLAGDENWLEAGTQIELEAFGSIDDLLRGKIRIVGDTQALDGVPPGQSSVLAEGIRSYIHIPLVVQSGLIGSILLAAENPAAFTTEHVEVASELSGQLAIGIHQAHLREQVQRHTQELEQQVAARTAQLARRTTQLRVAAEVARDAITAYDLDELLNRSVSLVRDRFGFYHAGLFLINEQGEYAVLRAAAGEAGRQMLEHEHKLEVGQVGIVGHACSSGEPRIALDVGADAVYFSNPLLPDTRSEMALPMRVGGRVIGALDVQSTKEAAFDQDDIDILQVMADQLAVAIERTRLFEQIQATLEEQLRTVVSHMPVMLFALDREGVFTLAEGKGLDTLGVSSADLVGRSVFNVYGDVSKALNAVRSALDGQASALAVETEDLALDMWCSPLRDAGGHVSGVLGVAVDVTERRHLEQQIQRQERLAAVGQLAGGIAHDFNNFLMTIVFYAHLLLRDEDTSPEIASIAETIVGEANRAAGLVRQVLDFSRRSVMDTQPVDLASFVEEVMDILQKTLPENIQVTVEIGSDDYTVEIDPTRIQQVIMNLALNARDAMPGGGKLHIDLSRVTVGPEGMDLPGVTEPQLATGNWVRLSVQDTGTGIDERVRKHLFEPFFTTKGPKGNGLGLAQVYGIVKQHQGEVGVETELGRGTTFQIYLPAHTKNHQTAEAEEMSGIPEGRGETILFIEDEDKVRDAGQRVLRSLGYRVLTASNGREGIETFRKAGQVDLVLTDMVMPEMGGREVAEQLKQIAPGIKILIVTGYTMEEDVQALKEAGFVDILYKPLDVSVLGRTIRRILDSKAENQ